MTQSYLTKDFAHLKDSRSCEISHAKSPSRHTQTAPSQISALMNQSECRTQNKDMRWNQTILYFIRILLEKQSQDTLRYQQKTEWIMHLKNEEFRLKISDLFNSCNIPNIENKLFVIISLTTVLNGHNAILSATFDIKIIYIQLILHHRLMNSLPHMT